MTIFSLTDEQSELLSQAKKPIRLVTRQGRTVGYLEEPNLTPEVEAELERRLASPNSGLIPFAWLDIIDEVHSTSSEIYS